jgi:SAM-dependent methyltransferase
MRNGNRSSPLGTEMIHRHPRGPIVDRVPHLLELCRDKRVIHLGFVDPGRGTTKRVDRGWLHAEVAGVARELVGIDRDESGVADARAQGYEVHVADCQDASALEALQLEPAEVVLAGELLEHVDQAAPFLDAIRQLVAPGGTIVVTTPNAFSILNFAAALLGREIVNPDHVCWYSGTTLQTLLERCAWRVDHLAYYALPHLVARQDFRVSDRLKLHAFNAFRVSSRPLVTMVPWLAHGLIVVASPKS